MLHAQLFPGQENSGRLVALLRQKAKEMAVARNTWLVLSDGPPGIGCPVISALSGVDLAVIVTEPTPSGRHDLERIASLCGHFKVPVAVIINKSDVSDKITRQIEAACDADDYRVVAKLQHDPVFVHAMVDSRAVTEYSDSHPARQIRQAWDNIQSLLISSSGLDVNGQDSVINAPLLTRSTG